ncbi:carboxypeptidase B-like [Sabethes cyaneus]|uniref:carboxypeptidase B-like n=1 Tax=Sabethes cyaneus TaxID=53552 RepID=UPI00237DD143|nr:carboxypeptidase B-like [Sabethes cyaneus]
MRFWPLLICCAILAFADSSKVSYANFQLFVVRPDTREKLVKLHDLTENENYDFWDQPRLNRDARVMVSHYDESRFEKILEQNDIHYDLVMDNVEQILDKQRKSNIEYHERTKRDSNSRSTIEFDRYWTLDEIYDYIEELAAAYPTVKVFEIGTTQENRPIKALSISSNGDISMERPVVFMDAGIHAREWVGVMSVVYMIHEFVEHSELYSSQLDNTDYFIIPVLNPDGYVYTHEVNRLWRKNRTQNNLLCAGVDLNRNFPFAWRFTSNGCTNTYAGVGPGSEIETKAMMDQMEKYKPALVMYIAVHTSGEMILWPWGYEMDHYCDNWEEHDDLGKQAAAAIREVGGNEWTVGNAADILYKASGATDDYGLYRGARLSYTIELTGGGIEGFDLPEAQLPKAVTDAMEIYKTFGAYVGTLALPTPSEE